MNNLKIGLRLGLGFGAIILLLAFVALFSILRLKSGGDKTDEIVNNRYAKVLLLSRVKQNASDYGHNLRNALLVSDAEDRKGFFDAMKKAAAGNSEAMDKFEKLIDAPQGVKVFQDIKTARANYADAAKRDVKLIEEGEREQATEVLLKEVIPAENAFSEKLSHLNDLITEVMDRTGKEGMDQAAYATVLVSALSVAAALLAAVIGTLITRSITLPLNQAVAIARAVAVGDLSSRIDVRGRDEAAALLQAIRDMNANLRKIVGDVRAGTEAIATASGQIASGNLDLSSRTEEQAGSLEETASSMEELTGTVKQNSESARQANAMALAASAAASEGGIAVAQVVDTMGSIRQSAEKIVDIIGVIDAIAFQTNILALNAAVEAARAGAQGRGFAVVASEVRNLAQRSAAAAKEIKALIGDSVEKVEHGVRQVDQAGLTMREIVGRVKRVTDIMGEIAAASQEQSAGIEQVNRAIMQMDDTTQQNASLVEEAAAAAASLEDQAGKLVQSVGMFKLDGESASPRANQLPPAHRPDVVIGGAGKPRNPGAANTAPSRQLRLARKIVEPIAAAGGEWEQF